jgi:hypothetical protein
MSRAAAEIEPVSRMLSSSLALPGPMRAPDSKTMLTLTRAMPGTVPRASLQSTSLAEAPAWRVAKLNNFAQPRLAYA